MLDFLLFVLVLLLMSYVLLLDFFYFKLKCQLLVFSGCYIFLELISCSQFQVKSRMMGDSSYKSTLDCFVKTLRNDVCWFKSNPLNLKIYLSMSL